MVEGNIIKSPKTLDEGHAEVCLVMPPFSFGNMPSLALGLLKSILNEEGITSYVDYANLYFLKDMDTKDYYYLCNGSMTEFTGEFLLNRAAGIENNYTIEGYLKDYLKRPQGEALDKETAMLYAIRERLEKEIDKTVERILAHSPRIVGCSAVFQQRNAALAILRKIKEKDQNIVTFMGGFNCFSYAGPAMVRKFPYLDYVFMGESDDIFAESIRLMMKGEKELLPYGLVGAHNIPDRKGEVVHRIVIDLEKVPMPDYKEYFEIMDSQMGQELIRDKFGSESVRGMLECSRGCWWGAKHACTFCGLNGKIRTFRRKSPEKALGELREFVSRYRTREIHFSDNIMPSEWFDIFLPKLKEEKLDLKMITEAKANLTSYQVKLLKEAGFTAIQPGIESLSDHTLTIMNKGVSAVQNIALLKYGVRYDLKILWNILTGFPDESIMDYADEMEIIEAIYHLMPPMGCFDIIYVRNSTYYENQDKYGLKLIPDDIFKYVSPEDPEYIEDIAFNFRDENENIPPLKIYWKQKLKSAVRAWISAYYGKGDKLENKLFMTDDGMVLTITDTRKNRVKDSFSLEGTERELYLLADSPVRLLKAAKTLNIDEEELRKLADKLCGDRIMICRSGCLLSLAI